MDGGRGCEEVVNTTPTPIPFKIPAKLPDRSIRPKHTGVSGLSQRFRGLGRILLSDRIIRPYGPDYPAPPTQNAGFFSVGHEGCKKSKLWDKIGLG